jgi:dTMP kinase
MAIFRLGETPSSRGENDDCAQDPLAAPQSVALPKKRARSLDKPELIQDLTLSSVNRGWRSTSAVPCRKIVPMPLITFEGSEGCGKSTQVKRLAARLGKCGLIAAVFREPGDTAIGEAIRHLLQHSEENDAMTPETELLLFVASRSQLVREKIRPALQRGEWVICDRFFDSTTVYQGDARHLDPGFVENLNAFAVGNCIPDLTFVLDIDRATAQSRLGNRQKIRDRMEEESDEFHERVIRAYRELAENESKRVVLIDGRMSIDEIENEIWRTISTRFPELAANQQSAISKRQS